MSGDEFTLETLDRLVEELRSMPQPTFYASRARMAEYWRAGLRVAPELCDGIDDSDPAKAGLALFESVSPSVGLEILDAMDWGEVER